MELFPALELGWRNGWILLAFEFLLQGGLLLVFPRDVVSRLFDRSGWSVKQRAFRIASKVFSLACLILFIFTLLKINSWVFGSGLLVYFIGLAGLVMAMLNFMDTPLDQPETKGVYKISRHPQTVALFVVFLGICVAIGSWVALFTLRMSRLLRHFSILAEEDVCLQRYGEPYRAYLERVPRYFLFF